MTTLWNVLTTRNGQSMSQWDEDDSRGDQGVPPALSRLESMRTESVVEGDTSDFYTPRNSDDESEGTGGGVRKPAPIQVDGAAGDEYVSFRSRSGPPRSPFLSPGKRMKWKSKASCLVRKHKDNLISPRRTEVKRQLYEPPDLDRALKHMNSFRPLAGGADGDGNGRLTEIFDTSVRKSSFESSKSKKTLRGKLSTLAAEASGNLPLPRLSAKMECTFSTGICFWFVALRDFCVMFLAFTLCSCLAFHLASLANSNSGNAHAQLNGLARASIGAAMQWGNIKSGAGDVSDADRNKILAMVCVDTALMIVLLCVAYHHKLYLLRMRAEVDEKTVTMEDYTVEVWGLPADATEARVRAHFERLIPGSSGPRVHEVNFGRDVGDVMALRTRLLSLEGKHDWLEWALLRAKRVLGEDDDEDDNEAARVEAGAEACVNSMGAVVKIPAADGEEFSNLTKIPDSRSLARTRWKRAVLSTKRKTALIAWEQTLTAARDKTRSMSERAQAAAKSARNAESAGLYLDPTKKPKRLVGKVTKNLPEDYNLDILKEKLRVTLRKREETADAIAACAQKGYGLVNAWVTFTEEKYCIDCLSAAKKSSGGGLPRMPSSGSPRQKSRGGSWRRSFDSIDGHSRSSLDMAHDVSWFEGQHRLTVKRAQDPSDVLWENLHFSRDSAWLRQLRSAVLTIILIFIGMAAISAAKVQTRLLPPKISSAACDLVGAGGKFLDCPAIWDLDASSSVPGQDTARVDIMPFVVQDIDYHSCSTFMSNSQFIGNMSAYKGFYHQSNTTAVDEFRKNGAAAVSGEGSWTGGFNRESNVDECAAHACYGCYCSQRGYYKHVKDEDGLGYFCKEYWSNETLRQLLWGFGIAVASSMNLIIKLVIIWLTRMERCHSLTYQELSISWKMMVALVLNTALLPIFMGSDIQDLRLVPFLFKGEYRDTTSEWYADIGNTIMQVAIINAFVFPMACISKIWLWQLMAKFFTPRVKTQRQLNLLYRPPTFYLSERYGPFAAATFYTIIFSSGLPLLYAVHVLWCVLQIAVDRLALFKYCASPPRYTGKLAAMLNHTVVVAILCHFCIAVYVFGQRSLPSWKLDGGISERWTGTLHPRNIVEPDNQFNVGARLARVNGFVPLVGYVTAVVVIIIGYILVFVARKVYVARNFKTEGCPPLKQAIVEGRIMGLTSYSITANPHYRHLFPPGEEVSEGL